MSLKDLIRRPEVASGAAIAAAVSVPLILLVIILLVGQGFDETAALRREVIRSYEMRADLQRILSLHQDMETGQRGYVITGERKFLEPYFTASDRINEEFAKLDRDMPRDLEMRSKFNQLRQASLDKRRFVAQSIAVASRGDKADAYQHVAGGEGKRFMDILRAQLTQIDESERAHLGRSTAIAEASRIRLRNRYFVFQTLLVLLLAGAAYLVIRSNGGRDRARRRSEDLATRQETIFDSAKDGMIVLNGSGSIEGLNPAAARMFGHVPGELVRRDIGNLFEVAPDRGQIESFLRRLLANSDRRVNEVQEFIGRRSDNSAFPLEVSLSVVPLADETKFLAVCRDISERREVEKIKSEFVATVSHELRTPLTSIAGSLSLITGGAAGPIPAKALKLVQIAHSNSGRLVRLVNDVLDIEKIEAGRMQFDIKPLPLEPILHRAVRDNESFADEYGVEIALEPVPANAVVLADEDRLMQVVTNLLSNAVKFSPRAGAVTITVQPLDRRFRISVSDQGDGVPEAFRERIFTKFAQADNSDSRQKGGTGLGLSIVREIVIRLGGSVSYDTQRGQGTTFHVDLPVAAAPAAAAPSPRTASASRRELPCILHVDDDPDMLRVLSDIFEGRAEILSARSIDEATTAIRDRNFKAAILDIGLVDGSGLDLVPLLRARSATMPIIVFTAQEADPRKIQGVDRMLIKSRATLDRLVDIVMTGIEEQRGQVK